MSSQREPAMDSICASLNDFFENYDIVDVCNSECIYVVKFLYSVCVFQIDIVNIHLLYFSFSTKILPKNATIT